MISDIAKMLSLFLTFPAIILSLFVVFVWVKQAVKSFKNTEKLAVDWLIMGVCVGFLGSVLDNAYWGIAWSLRYIESDYADLWFDTGVFFNIFFRQIACIVSAYCHIKSFQVARQITVNNVNTWTGSVLIGFVYVLILSFFKK